MKLLLENQTEANTLLTNPTFVQPAKETRLMETISQDEIKAHLMATDQNFRRLAEQHAEYHRQLETLEAKSHLTLEDEAEEHRLKKLKLHLKDQMTGIIAHYRTQSVA
jgi:uncharacterized protein YdcH (DUF465 family)